MAYTTINDPSAFFQAVTYTGNGSNGHAITFNGNSNLQPDWLWGKERSQGGNHNLFDTSRGLDKRLTSDQADGENTDSTTVTAMNTNGFTLGSSNNINENGVSTVAWCWKCNGGTTSSNSSGSITSTVQANTTAGFSIVTYTGNAVSGATVGHGLTVAPQVIFMKRRDGSRDWLVYHQATSVSATRGSFLNLTNASDGDNGYFNNTEPTSSVFSLGNNSKGNGSGDAHIAYCFAEKKGYSKFGTYTGNGQNGGPFIYTGFAPAWVMVKRVDSGQNWPMWDNKRGFNGNRQELYANLNNAEATDSAIDILSNAFKVRDSSSEWNADGGDYLYMAFAENPFVSSAGVPTTAR